MAVEGLVYWGTIDAASDQTMATVTRTANSEFREALEELIQAVAAGIIASDPTVIAAAVAAVDAALAAQPIVLSRVVSATGGTWTDLNAVNAVLPIALDVRSTALNRPISSAVSSMGWHIPSGNGSAVQVLTTSSTNPSQWMRSRAGGVWSAWVRIVDQTVLDARVSGLIAELSMMVAVPEDDVIRTTRTVIPITFTNKTRNTFYPAIYPAIYPAVEWTGAGRRSADIPALGVDGKLSPDVIPDTPLGILVGLQVRAVEGGPVVLEVRPDGKVYVEGVPLDPGAGGSTPKRAVIVAALGQSNNVSYAQPVVPMLDGAAERIWQMPYNGSSLTPASVPLSTRDVNASGLSPAHVLARAIAANDPECVVVIVPAAMGGSGLVTDSSFGVWSVGYAGANPKLYDGAVAMMTTALEQITLRWGLTPTTIATWVQGEQDGAASVTRAAYVAALDTLIADWKTRYGGVFLAAGIVPQTATSGTRPEIVLGLQDTPRRVQSTAFVDGVDNGGGSRGATDVIHYGREAAEIIGAGWFDAIPRAFNNITGSATTPPLKVSAERWAGQVTVSWSAPYCRVTAYEVQSSTDGSTWTPVTIAEPVATHVSFASASPVMVRVRAIGTDTSAWTKPVIAVGG